MDEKIISILDIAQKMNVNKQYVFRIVKKLNIEKIFIKRETSRG